MIGRHIMKIIKLSLEALCNRMVKLLRAWDGVFRIWRKEAQFKQKMKKKKRRDKQEIKH